MLIRCVDDDLVCRAGGPRLERAAERHTRMLDYLLLTPRDVLIAVVGPPRVLASNTDRDTNDDNGVWEEFTITD